MICPTCGEECTPYPEDVGYGYTEAWGIPDNDVDIRWFCDLCENEVDEPDSYDGMDFDPEFH